MIYKIIVMFAFFVSTFTANAQQNDPYKLLERETFKDSLSLENIQLIDVRTPEEYAAGHIPSAENIDFFSEQFGVEFNKLNKEKPVYIYCRSGSRSKKAAAKLSALGFKKIYDLEGGFLNYE